MDCPECKKEMEEKDTTFANYTSERVKKHEHTGNIYWCETCECHWLENLIEGGELERFYY